MNENPPWQTFFLTFKYLALLLPRAIMKIAQFHQENWSEYPGIFCACYAVLILMVFIFSGGNSGSIFGSLTALAFFFCAWQLVHEKSNRGEII